MLQIAVWQTLFAHPPPEKRGFLCWSIVSPEEIESTSDF